MLMALILLAAIDAVPAPTVSLTLTGDSDRPPVSATPRSLSDVARELREGRKAVGNFSAAETTVPQRRSTLFPAFEPEPDVTEPEPEPEPVAEAPVYVPAYPPVWFGGRQPSSRLHRRSAARFAAPRAASPPPGRPSAPAFRMRHSTAGPLRER